VTAAGSERTTVAPSDEAYVPQVSIIVDDQNVTANILPDVLELRVTLQKDELGGFTMQLANHFEVPTQGETDDSGKDAGRRFRHSDEKLLDVFKTISIQMGYVGRMSTMFVGEISMLQPSFPSSGMPTFTVTGIDMLNKLRRTRPNGNETKAYHNKADWQIAEQIAKRHDLVLSKDSTRDGERHPQVMQRDQDDLKFILYLAKRNDFECTVIIDNAKPALYFGPPRDKRGPQAVQQIGLAYGESLISFTPKLTVGKLVSKVTVRAWDARKKTAFDYTATLNDIPKTGSGKTGPDLLEEKGGAKEDRIVDRVVQSQEEAKKLAIQLLTETANQFLTGSGEAMGEPKIRPQTNLEITGLGRRFDGVYYVTKVEHVYSASGYTTSFDVERLREGTT
jgi:phage protein D